LFTIRFGAAKDKEDDKLVKFSEILEKFDEKKFVDSLRQGLPYEVPAVSTVPDWISKYVEEANMPLMVVDMFKAKESELGVEKTKKSELLTYALCFKYNPVLVMILRRAAVSRAEREEVSSESQGSTALINEMPEGAQELLDDISDDLEEPEGVSDLCNEIEVEKGSESYRAVKLLSKEFRVDVSKIVSSLPSGAKKESLVDEVLRREGFATPKNLANFFESRSPKVCTLNVALDCKDIIAAKKLVKRYDDGIRKWIERTGDKPQTVKLKVALRKAENLIEKGKIRLLRHEYMKKHGLGKVKMLPADLDSIMDNEVPKGFADFMFKPKLSRVVPTKVISETFKEVSHDRGWSQARNAIQKNLKNFCRVPYKDVKSGFWKYLTTKKSKIRDLVEGLGGSYELFEGKFGKDLKLNLRDVFDPGEYPYRDVYFRVLKHFEKRGENPELRSLWALEICGVHYVKGIVRIS
jgi:hypothetical protein